MAFFDNRILDADAASRFNRNMSYVVTAMRTAVQEKKKKLKKEAMYIAMVENTCNIQKGRDLNPIWLPLLRHFS